MPMPSAERVPETAPEYFDDDLTLTVGVSDEYGAYIQATRIIDGKEYLIAERIPAWIVRTFNYASRRAKDPSYRGQG